MWSGPRNISTAMMRSFAARGDCAVSDEPFYGAFLKDSGEPHPMGAETIASMECDWQRVREMLSGDAPGGASIWYQKHMPHHMIGPVDIADFPDHIHAFLIRPPERVVASYRAKNELSEARALGFAAIRSYVAVIEERTGVTPPIVDADRLVHDPAGMLEKLCSALGIAWTPAMLSWPKGPHPDDGIWGQHWYDKVNASTGFDNPPGALPELEGDYAATAAACREDYEHLLAKAL
jgi:hypothetical protein